MRNVLYQDGARLLPKSSSAQKWRKAYDRSPAFLRSVKGVDIKTSKNLRYDF